ncbi:DUF6879 family protein [Kibdelosporangium banguiense]|nr:DUF6879 family protein [Kibdelosporangium banguiense]
MWVDPHDGLTALFNTVTRRSWRWECQGYYEVDRAALERWLRGEPEVEDEADRAWVTYIRTLTQAGIPFERVRMQPEPPTDYIRWMLDTTTRNIEAGEDIRWITESRARELGMPTYDFYLFDDSRLAILHFDADALLTGVEVIDDGDVVDQHRQLRDRVWPHAVLHSEYVR